MAKKPPHPFDRITGVVLPDGKCQWCGSEEPGRAGFRHSEPFHGVEIGCHHVRRNDCRWSPLVWLSWSRRLTQDAGMNWLQDRGLISDNCVGPETVASVDVERIAALADAPWILAFQK